MEFLSYGDFAPPPPPPGMDRVNLRPTYFKNSTTTVPDATFCSPQMHDSVSKVGQACYLFVKNLSKYIVFFNFLGSFLRLELANLDRKGVNGVF